MYHFQCNRKYHHHTLSIPFTEYSEHRHIIECLNLYGGRLCLHSQCIDCRYCERSRGKSSQFLKHLKLRVQDHHEDFCIFKVECSQSVKSEWNAIFRVHCSNNFRVLLCGTYQRRFSVDARFCIWPPRIHEFLCCNNNGWVADN